MFCVVIDFYQLSRDHVIKYQNDYHHRIQRTISVNLNIILSANIDFYRLARDLMI